MRKIKDEEEEVCLSFTQISGAQGNIHRLAALSPPFPAHTHADTVHLLAIYKLAPDLPPARCQQNGII